MRNPSKKQMKKNDSKKDLTLVIPNANTNTNANKTLDNATIVFNSQKKNNTGMVEI